MAELFNTAIEVLVDLVSPDIHPKAKIVKDVASAAVLVAAIFAAIVGLIIFIPKL
jgi:diacylglycerol kinase